MANEVGSVSFTNFVQEGKLCVVSSALVVGDNAAAALTALALSVRDNSALILQAPFKFEAQTLEGLFLSRPKFSDYCIPVITFRVLKMRQDLFESLRPLRAHGLKLIGRYEITASFDDLFLLMMSL